MYRIWSSKDFAWIDVPNAEKIEIKGFEEFDLFIHNRYGDYGFDMKQWTVSEALTGGSIASYCNSKQDAIRLATQRLNDVGVERFRAEIEKHQNKG